MNRAERRAKKTPPQLMGFRFGVTPDEAEILEEALALWMAQTREDWGATTLTTYQQWALERAEKLRQAVAAAIGNRPWRDVGTQRMPPTAGALQTVFDLHAQVECKACALVDRGAGTSCRTCGHGEQDEHYDGTCETVLALKQALEEVRHA